MKAFALVAPGNFGPAELPDEPPPANGEVVVRPVACGICASDVHYWLHGRIGSQIITAYPYAIGHESAGVIVAVGPGVANVRPGQRVAIEPGRSCLRCAPCAEGRENVCPNVQFLGTPMVQGAMRETILTAARNVEPLPDSLPVEHAALCEPLGVGIHSVRLVGLAPGETVAIFGAGPIGLSTAVAARDRGARRIILAEPVRERRAIAQHMGFDAIPTDPDPVAEIRRITDGGADATFEAAGDLKAITSTLAAARLGGRACIIGIPAEDYASIDLHTVRRAELTIHNCRRSNRTLPDALRLIAGPGSGLASICTHRFPLADAERAFNLVSRRADGVVKAMLLFE